MPAAVDAVAPASATCNVNLEQLQHKQQAFQHIFEQLVQQSGGNHKLPPKQLEHLRHLLSNVRDGKNLQLVLEKFKNLEQLQEHYVQLGCSNNNTVITEDSDTALKDNARKFGAGGQTLTPRHTIDAILGLKNRNGQPQSQQQQQLQADNSDGDGDACLADEDATDLRCSMSLTQLRSMDNHMASMLQQHAKNGLHYGPPTPPAAAAAPAQSAPQSLQQHAGSFGYHNAFGFVQSHGQHGHHGHGYAQQEDVASNYLNSMHQMVEANQLQPVVAPPPPPPPGAYGTHQQHLAALAAHAQEQQQHHKYVKSSPPTATTASSYFVPDAAAATTQLGVAAPSTAAAAAARDFDERSLSSGSELEDDEDDATKQQQQQQHDNNIDVTTPPTPRPLSNASSIGCKRKSSSVYCDDNEPKLANGQQLGNYSIRARSLDEVQQ
ncbi:Rx, partial [Drosophila busckii]